MGPALRTQPPEHSGSRPRRRDPVLRRMLEVLWRIESTPDRHRDLQPAEHPADVSAPRDWHSGRAAPCASPHLDSDPGRGVLAADMVVWAHNGLLGATVGPRRLN